MTDVNTEFCAQLVGNEVTRVCFDRQLRLLFDSGWSLQINGEGMWTASEQAPVPLDVDEPGAVSASLLGLLWQRVSDVVVDASEQSLTMRSMAGVIHVNEQLEYEAWQLNGPRGEMIIATPSGGSGLAIWGPRDDA